MTSEQRWERKIIFVHVPQLRHDSPIIQSPTMTSAPHNLRACHTWRFSGPTTDLLNQNLRLPKSSGDSLVYRHSRRTSLEWNSLEQWFPITFVLSDGNCLNEIILGGNKKKHLRSRAPLMAAGPEVSLPSPWWHRLAPSPRYRQWLLLPWGRQGFLVHVPWHLLAWRTQATTLYCLNII